MKKKILIIFSVFKYLDPDPGSESGYASLTAHIQEADWERRSQEQVLVNKMLDMATSVGGGGSAAITFSFLPSQYQEKRQHLLFWATIGGFLCLKVVAHALC